jgi:hypothetical protein
VFLFVYLVSLATGLTQLLLAWFGHIMWDSTWTRPIDQVQVPWFGYLATSFWWVPYVISVPVMVACSVQGLFAVSSLCEYAKCRTGTLVVACVAGLGLAFIFAGHDLVRSFTVLPDEWAQWSDVLARPSGSMWSPRYRVAVLLLGYIHYFVAYGVCTACVIGALLVAGRIRVPQSIAARAASSRSLSELLLSVKIVVAGWLFYLVLLRSSKLQMWLIYRNQPPALDHIYDFLKDARPYFEASREGIFTNILLGLLWTGICFAIHVLSASILNTSGQPRFTTIGGLLENARAGYDLIGSWWTGFLGLCLLGIVLPPPSGWHMLAVVGVLIGGFLVKRSFHASE